MDRIPGFNAQLLKFLRKQSGWTQEDFAARAGLSVRVIAKAEAGQTVAKRTTAALVKALNRSGHDVSAADLITDPSHLVRRFLHNYAEYQADCVQHCLDFLSPEIMAYIDGDPVTNPIAGTYRGIDEFDKLWRKFFAIFVRDGGSLAENPSMRVAGTEVIAWGYENIRVPEAPAQPPGFVMLRVRFADGMMTYFEDRYEASGMMHQLAKWAEEFPEAEWLEHVDQHALTRGDFRKPYSPWLDDKIG